MTAALASSGSAEAASISVSSSHRMSFVLLAREREEPLAQPTPRPVETHLGGGGGDPELFGDGLVGHVVDVAEDDDRLQARRQLLESIAQAVTQVGGHGQALGVAVGR